MCKYYETSVAELRLRCAEEKDAALIVELIRGLAVYEKMTDRAPVTEELLRENLFGKKLAEVIIAEYKGEPVGYALFFQSFSTFLGKGNLYLEDLFVKPEARGCGAGKALLACIAKIAEDRGFARVEWMCLDWNEPSIRFYKQMGANPLDSWTVYRLGEDALPQLAARL
jgi:Sortase and related acyltransferases